MDAPSTEITHTIFPEHKLVYILLRGQNTISVLMDYITQLVNSDPDFEADMDFLINASEARTTRQNTKSERNDLTDHMQQFGRSCVKRVKVATVQPVGTFEYGLSRMYSVEMTDSIIDNHLFEDFSQALEWLGKPQLAGSFPA